MRKMSNKFIFLSKEFYNDYPTNNYPEIEQKETRPYIQVVINIDDIIFAIPMRSNINHPYALFTDKANKCGLDFSKTVVINDDKYIEKNKTPYIRPNEFNALRGKEYRIKKKLMEYIKKYKKAKADITLPFAHEIVSNSTLQYFEKYI